MKPSVGTHRGGSPADRRARRVTIREIADAAGVSVSTVSHVLNEYGDIGPDTERRVRQVMKEMNYYPSSLARRLVKK
ncbi:MAG: LacI family DNA-binding transcriptional regulator, partial [Firmicutes bacterium]|nr:LacI family DNA-binding transcriptional regulator [Bacillota bacterium]